MGGQNIIGYITENLCERGMGDPQDAGTNYAVLNQKILSDLIAIDIYIPKNDLIAMDIDIPKCLLGAVLPFDDKDAGEFFIDESNRIRFGVRAFCGVLEMNYIGTAEHGGTHLDSPAHFYKDRLRTHNIPIENLVGPGVIINVKNKAAANVDYQVSIDDLKQWENIYDQIPENAVVIMNSGWNDRYPNASLVFNTDSPTDSSTFHFPSWHEKTIEWLISERSVNVIGVDTPSNDFGQSKTFPVHILLAQANIPGAENVANLDAVPEAGSNIFVAVTKIYDGSGGPARIFATVPIKDTSSGCSHGFSFVLLMNADPIPSSGGVLLPWLFRRYSTTTSRGAPAQVINLNLELDGLHGSDVSADVIAVLL
ncbi:unnamed protein product [Mytilus edulis]|uniref:Cyclase n=1 Tax=Mytilus edulis TaxID=6550 RepID=A0A8S3PNQ0_MYTED|nr:unnamed protein product [Mytilus edulis]